MVKTAKIYVCDLCGKEIGTSCQRTYLGATLVVPNDHPLSEYTRRLIIFAGDLRLPSKDTADLCRECKKALETAVVMKAEDVRRS